VTKGTVNWFYRDEGLWIIQPNSKDVFAYISGVEQAGLTTLNGGQVVEYQEASNPAAT
jgi:cold shock protein